VKLKPYLPRPFSAALDDYLALRDKPPQQVHYPSHAQWTAAMRKHENKLNNLRQELDHLVRR
jgi:hypothetical protein